MYSCDICIYVYKRCIIGIGAVDIESGNHEDYEDKPVPNHNWSRRSAITVL